MKKVLNLKTIIMIILSLIILGTNLSVFATGDVLGSGNNSTPIDISQNEYANAGTIPTDQNYTSNNMVGNNVSNGINTSSAYNTNNSTDLPQTGIEDYNIGILLIICVAASIYTYKKMKDYKNV